MTKRNRSVKVCKVVCLLELETEIFRQWRTSLVVRIGVVVDDGVLLIYSS
jgi:hypothetical protein